MDNPNLERAALEKDLSDVDKHLAKPPIECPKCGGPFRYEGLGSYSCKDCGEPFKNEYARVREFVERYGTSYSIMEIAAETGVSKKVIDLFVKDGKFDTAQKQRVCISCKQPIQTGQYCKRCALLQIGNEIDEDRKKNISGSLRVGNMQGSMHHGRSGKY